MRTLTKYICLLLITLTIDTQVKAQLYLHNPSFEIPPALPIGTILPVEWTPCASRPDGSVAGANNFDTLARNNPFIGVASHKYGFIGMIARSYFRNIDGSILYPEVNFVTISSKFLCNQLQQDHRYKITVDAHRDSVIAGDPYLYIFMGNNACDTNQTIYSDYVRNLSWAQKSTSFIAGGNWQHLTIRCRHTYKDSSTVIGKEPVFVFLDNFSPVVPDTAYNSTQFPIKVQCNGNNSYTLTSPYAGIQDQYWYTNNKLVGNGETITINSNGTNVYTLTLGKDSCIASVLQTTVYPDCELTVYFPNAFTPNGDGHNPTFRALQSAQLSTLLTYKLQVYSRSGKRVFITEDYKNGWDGGSFDAGVYFYLCNYTLPDGRERKLHGDVTLVR